MDERAIRSLIRDVKADRLTRRRFVQIMVGLGLTAPMAAQMLAASGVAAQPKAASPAFAPTKRGGGGPLKVLWWQAPTLLNPYFATGTKDQDGSRIFYEPLAAFDPDGNLVPILAAEVPSTANGGLVQGRHVGHVEPQEERALARRQAVHRRRRRLHLGVRRRPRHRLRLHRQLRRLERVEKLDSHSVKVVFKKPTPFWADRLLRLPRA